MFSIQCFDFSSRFDFDVSASHTLCLPSSFSVKWRIGAQFVRRKLCNKWVGGVVHDTSHDNDIGIAIGKHTCHFLLGHLSIFKQICHVCLRRHLCYLTWNLRKLVETSIYTQNITNLNCESLLTKYRNHLCSMSTAHRSAFSVELLAVPCGLWWWF